MSDKGGSLGDDHPGPWNGSLLWGAFRARRVSRVACICVGNVGNRSPWPSASVFVSDRPKGLELLRSVGNPWCLFKFSLIPTSIIGISCCSIMEPTGHIILLPYPGWGEYGVRSINSPSDPSLPLGHQKPFALFASKLVQYSSAVTVTFLTAGDFPSLLEKEISISLSTSGVNSRAKENIRSAPTSFMVRY